jgi:hypothetical protein
MERKWNVSSRTTAWTNEDEEEDGEEEGEEKLTGGAAGVLTGDG